MYDQARYRQRLGLAHQTHSFAQIARIALEELRLRIDASTGRTAYTDYVSCIERYFLPYFGERQLEELTHTDIQQYLYLMMERISSKSLSATPGFAPVVQ